MNPSACPTTPGTLSYLEHFPEPGGPLRRVPITRYPFRVGRAAGADLVIYCPRVSKAHAEIVQEEDDLCIVDLGSTNGTFVNGRRVEDRALLSGGDIIHLAEKEFRLSSEESPPGSVHEPTEAARLSDPRSLIQGAVHLEDLIQKRLITTLFQPIVTLAERHVVAWEALGRGQHEALPSGPTDLFALAEKLRLAPPLSRAFRKVAVEEFARVGGPMPLFLNMHPHELPDRGLLESLAHAGDTLRPGQDLVLEIHEDCIPDAGVLDRLRQGNVRLAFDDFGVGKDRLAALTQVRVDFVKFDRTIVRGLPHSAPLRELMRTLGQVCAGLGTQVLAEGVETEEEARVCLDLGCTHGQGYLFGRPQPAGQL
jgi:EAL domain-containing protein (putative c-di-GMP-specific phosphodiesterase class I)